MGKLWHDVNYCKLRFHRKKMEEMQQKGKING
jgi:hypothetical protein